MIAKDSSPTQHCRVLMKFHRLLNLCDVDDGIVGAGADRCLL